MAAFNTPNFLLNHSTDEIHDKMIAVLPADIDMSEGSHVWNLTRPTALIAAELCEFILPEVIKLIFPEHSYGEYLDGHAKARSMSRRAATFAVGELAITGSEGTFIPAGSLFSTASINNEPSIHYETLEDGEINGSGTITVPIQCTQAGVIGNTPSNTIIFTSGNGDGITSVTNANPVEGGTEEEDDESLIVRILAYDQNKDNNFVGSVSDYKRWAMSVDGVGNADVIPAKDDSGIVTIILTDANSQPANEQLCENVYNYIMNPDHEAERLAPVNALLSVVPPSTMSIAIKAVIELDEETTIESVKQSYISKLSAYLPIAMEEKEIKYTKIYSYLSSTEGVNDFSNLQIGIKGESYGTNNIPLTTSTLPEISEIEFVVGTV